MGASDNADLMVDNRLATRGCPPGSVFGTLRTPDHQSSHTEVKEQHLCSLTNGPGLPVHM